MSRKDAGEKQETKGILVNRVNLEFDEDLFFDRFVILRTKYVDIKKRNEAARLLKPFKTVLAIRYEMGADSFFVLLDGKSERDAIIQKLNTVDVTMDVCRKIDSLNMVDDVTLIIDLLNIGSARINKDEDAEDRMTYSNLQGSIYTYENGDITKDKVTAFKVSYHKADGSCRLFGDNRVDFNAQSFGNVKKVAEDPKAAKTLDRYIPYVASNSQLNMADSYGDLIGLGERYVARGYKGMDKAVIPFINIDKSEEFDASKMGRLRNSMRKFRKAYRDVGTGLEFERTYLFDGDSLGVKKPIDNSFFNELVRCYKGIRINIIDKVGNDRSRIISDTLSKVIGYRYGIEAEPSDEVRTDGFNI